MKLKRTNEFKMAISMLNAIDIQDKDITADALLTQRKLADYLCRHRKALYHFTVKINQPGLFEDISLYFQDLQKPDFIIYDPPDHGWIETRKIWTITDRGRKGKVPPRPPNRACGSPAHGSPVGGFLIGIGAPE